MKKEKYYVSYHRGTVYSDGTKDARLEIDELFNDISLQELIRLIERNQKALSLREDDVINFSKQVELTDFGYIIRDNDGSVVHKGDKNHNIVIQFNFLDDAEECENVLKALGFPEPKDPIEDMKAQYPRILSLLTQGLGIEESSGKILSSPDINNPKINYNLNFSFYQLKLKNPFYAHNTFFLEFARKYGTSFKLITLNTEVELIQLYSKYRLDEGVGTHYNWDYLMEDYGEEMLGFIDTAD